MSLPHAVDDDVKVSKRLETSLQDASIFVSIVVYHIDREVIDTSKSFAALDAGFRGGLSSPSTYVNNWHLLNAVLAEHVGLDLDDEHIYQISEGDTELMTDLLLEFYDLFHAKKEGNKLPSSSPKKSPQPTSYVGLHKSQIQHQRDAQPFSSMERGYSRPTLLSAASRQRPPLQRKLSATALPSEEPVLAPPKPENVAELSPLMKSLLSTSPARPLGSAQPERLRKFLEAFSREIPNFSPSDATAALNFLSDALPVDQFVSDILAVIWKIAARFRGTTLLENLSTDYLPTLGKIILRANENRPERKKLVSQILYFCESQRLSSFFTVALPRAFPDRFPEITTVIILEFAELGEPREAIIPILPAIEAIGLLPGTRGLPMLAALSNFPSELPAVAKQLCQIAINEAAPEASRREAITQLIALGVTKDPEYWMMALSLLGKIKAGPILDYALSSLVSASNPNLPSHLLTSAIMANFDASNLHSDQVLTFFCKTAADGIKPSVATPLAAYLFKVARTSKDASWKDALVAALDSASDEGAEDALRSAFEILVAGEDEKITAALQAAMKSRHRPLIEEMVEVLIKVGSPSIPELTDRLHKIL